ncbi:HdeD family acid-resistance protein [Kribbella sp. CA-247076]|uniref:HdeD family acid-resistance protein n=1 Tax=Kribbella sp. CA-247076 TaxID=3239941 RepID=UPI003D8B134F
MTTEGTLTGDETGTIPKSLLWRGLLAIAIGVVSLIWPDVTVGAFVILFAVYAFVAAVLDAVRAFTSDRGWSVAGRLLLAVLSLAAGVVALVWPGPTALVLTLIVGYWALFTGVVEIALVFTSGRRAGERAWLILSGLLSIAFALALFIRPDLGALSLATVFGLFSIFYGISTVVTAGDVRRLTHPPRRVADAVS